MDSKQFITKLSKKSALGYKETSSLVASVATAIAELASEEGSVAIPSFGTFYTSKYSEEIRTDLSTGKKMLFPPHIDLHFEASSILKKNLSESN